MAVFPPPFLWGHLLGGVERCNVCVKVSKIGKGVQFGGHEVGLIRNTPEAAETAATLGGSVLRSAPPQSSGRHPHLRDLSMCVTDSLCRFLLSGVPVQA